ncbi:MAG: ABC transporter ATP-binding protein [Gemmatimonadales bacterium]|nr:ABC transporter ATP-binding protein [Gemmatimonadales bacterium]
MTRVLDVENLRVSFPDTGKNRVYPVDGVSLSLDRGETLALVGESGCGKSLTSLALLRLVPSPGRIEEGSAIRLGGTDVLALQGEALRKIRGRRIGMIFQDPMTSLNPVFTVGNQIAEGVRAHFDVSKSEAWQRALKLLEEVGIPDPAARLDSYPHQLSGGMRQRVMIAIALSAEPEILVADEPTTALDVTVQAQILEVLDRLRDSHGMAVLLITHDLGIVAGRADRVAVMYAGQIVEEAPTDRLFARPSHPYTQGLFASVPRITGPVGRLSPIGGSVPPPGAWPGGCRFRPRCPQAFEKSETMPPLLPVETDHRMRCWLAENGADASD